MYDYFKGKLAEKGAHHAVVEVGGIGYKLFLPSSLPPKLPPEGKDVFFYAVLVVRENSQALYGFPTKEERDLFELLITISGIGPKIALGIMGHFDPFTFQDAVRQGNAMALTKAPGIGRKTAEKLILELKSRLKLTFSPQASHTQDALNALLRLGYSQTSAEHAVHKALVDIPNANDLPTLITAALKYPR